MGERCEDSHQRPSHSGKDSLVPTDEVLDSETVMSATETTCDMAHSQPSI